jgi:DedD protein
LILAGIGVVVIGGLYLANMLFFSEPPAPPTPTRPAVQMPSPPGQAPGPQAQARKDATAGPIAPTQASPPVKAESKIESKAETKTVVSLPPPKGADPAAAPTKPPTSPSAPEKSVTPTKPTPASPSPVKPSAPVAKAETKTVPKNAALSGKGFSVQIGAMAQQANAENLKKKLDALGFEAVIRKGSGFTNSHIVTVGDPTGKNEAEAMARRLGVDGFPATLASLEGKYSPQVGSFLVLDEAIDMARELQRKNYRPKITSKPSTTTLYQVRHGKFDTREAALKRGEELKAKGFTAWVVSN